MIENLSQFKKPLNYQKLQIEEIIQFVSKFTSPYLEFSDINVFYVNSNQYSVWFHANSNAGYYEVHISVHEKGNYVHHKNKRVGKFNSLSDLNMIFKKLGIRRD